MKRFAKVEKIQGGELSDCKARWLFVFPFQPLGPLGPLGQVLDGVMFNKDITHPRMRREIKAPRAPWRHFEKAWAKRSCCLTAPWSTRRVRAPQLSFMPMRYMVL